MYKLCYPLYKEGDNLCLKKKKEKLSKLNALNVDANNHIL